MDISVIIVSWNVKGLLEKCLASLFLHTPPTTPPHQVRGRLSPPPRAGGGISFEVIVVDNASTDGTAQWLKQRHAELVSASSENRFRNKFGMTIITNPTNKGFAAANNQGIKESSGKYILFLNPDTELTENSLKKVFDRMESDASIGVLGCALRNPDGTLQPSVRRFPRLRDIVIIFFKLYKLFPSLLSHYLVKDFDYTREQEVDQVMGAFMCIRRSVIDTIGLLDDKYFIWFEEVDFCRRARQVGFKVVYWPGTSIIHHGGQSFSQVETAKKQWWFFRSAWRYLTK